MSSTAGLGVNSLDVDHSQGVSRHHSALVEVESELPFGLGLVHEGLFDGVAAVDNSVGRVFNFEFLFL